MNEQQLAMVHKVLGLLRSPDQFAAWQREMFGDRAANETAVYRIYPAETFELAAEYLESVLRVEDEWELVSVGQGVTLRVHARKSCRPPCPIHEPSDHHMVGWQLHWRDDRKIFERLCPDNGIGHPDPDTMRYLQGTRRWDSGVHGCDGCCRPPAKEQPRSIAA
jgi:hypothetical protein